MTAQREKDIERGPASGKQDGRQEFIDDFPAELEVDFRAVAPPLYLSRITESQFFSPLSPSISTYEQHVNDPLQSLSLFLYRRIRQHKIYCRVDWIIMRHFAGRQGGGRRLYGARRSKRMRTLLRCCFF
jgi:hypothetical protein